MTASRVGLLLGLCLIAAVSCNADPVQHSWIYKCNATIGYVHMSTIKQVSDNRLVVAFQAAPSTEGSIDQKIFFTSSTDNGTTWAEPVVAVEADFAVWGPVFHWDDSTNTLWLFFSRSGIWNHHGGPDRNYPGGDILYQTSTDLGATWNAPVLMLPFHSKTRGSISKMTANSPIVNSQGWWLLPFWQEAHTVNDTGPACSGVFISKDSGATWAPYAFIQTGTTWLIENTLAETEDGIIQFFRTTTGYIWQSTSADGGMTWSTPVPTKLLNPNSKVYMFSRPGYSEQVLAYNPSKTQRTPLTLAVSTDGKGQLWSNLVTLDDVAMCPECGEFEYPTSFLLPSGSVLTTYSASTSVGIRLAATFLPVP